MLTDPSFAGQIVVPTYPLLIWENPGLVLWFVVGSILIIGCTASLPEAEDRPETAAPSATAMEPDGVAVETATPSATAMEPDGVAVINELIACEPGTWDRSRLLENLEREGDKYIEDCKDVLGTLRACQERDADSHFHS